jgi:hypothetical protein
MAGATAEGAGTAGATPEGAGTATGTGAEGAGGGIIAGIGMVGMP